MMKLSVRYAVILCAIFLAGCSLLRSAASPDRTYSSNAENSRSLQVPPDLTDVSGAEQYIVPGTAGAAVTRNTLLPQFNSVQFVRDGQQSWLEFDQAPEQIWQKVLAFTRHEKFQIERTQPIAGAVVTQWRPASAVAKSGLLKNLIGSDDSYTRVAFRIERDGAGARLFARSQQTEDKTETEATSVWPSSSHDPENTSALLTRLLAFLGVDEQKAKGILTAEQVSSILDDATLKTTGSGTQLIVYSGFQPTFNAVMEALNTLNYPVSSSDDGVGRIEFGAADAPRVLEISATHSSEVRIAVADGQGRRLAEDEEQTFLKSLLAKLA